MARKPRTFAGDIPCHVMNRASARAKIFHKQADYLAFENVLHQAVDRFQIRLLAYIVMPNHFHLVLWPRKNEGPRISRFMKWLQQTHTQRWHSHYHNAGQGRLYQGRFKAFPIQSGFSDYQHLRKVCRYVERNALRANLVQSAELWQHSSLHHRLHPDPDAAPFLADWPKGAYPGHTQWLARLNQPLTPPEEKALAQSLARQSPFGSAPWQAQTAATLDLQHTLRPRGRPKKPAPQKTATPTRTRHPK